MKKPEELFNSTKNTSFEKKLSNTKDVAESECFILEKSLEMVPPDGGWGWMIVLGSVVVTVLGTFPMYAFSILFSPILMSFSVSSTKTSWIFNFHSLIWSCFTIFVGPLCEEFGWRKVAIFGGLVNFLSLLLSAFVPSPNYLFFSFSVLGGIAGSTSFSLSYFVVSKYFKKHLGFALGITTVGSCASIFAAPLVANYLLENYDYTGALLIFAAIILNQCVGGSLFHPVERHMKPMENNIQRELILNEKSLQTEGNDSYKETNETKSFKNNREVNAISTFSSDSHSSSSKSELSTHSIEEMNNKSKDKHFKKCSTFVNVLISTYENLKSLKYKRVQLIALSYCCLVLGYINFQMWIPFVITNGGYSLEIAAWCSSLIGIGNFVGRLITTMLADRKFFNAEYGYMFGLLVIGLCTIGFSFVENITLYMTLACIWGVGLGSALGLVILAMIKVMGVKMLPAVLGISALCKGFGGITIGTLAGVIRDATDSYTYSLLMLGGLELFGFFLWLLMPLGKKMDERKYSNPHKEQKSLNDI